MNERKIIQIALAHTNGCCLFALCDDGTVWLNENPFAFNSKWEQVGDVPQHEEEEIEG